MALTEYSFYMLIQKNFTDPPHRSLCTDCGVSRTALAKSCGQVCQFIKPNYTEQAIRIHGTLNSKLRPPQEEPFFGRVEQMWQARMRNPIAGAQWTGITTRIAEKLLETGKVDAVLTMAPDPNDQWKPVPVLVTQASDLAVCRGMRMGYAPLLALLETAQEHQFKRLAVIGIPCQIHALRGLEQELGLEALYVIGTPCSDNTTTQNFHEFLALVAKKIKRSAASISYLEFRADYHVELRFKEGGQMAIPFLQLPLSDLRADFFPLTCKTCVDYTNRLSDITVGYMGGRGEQWLLVRNKRGQELIELLGDEVILSAPSTAGNREGAVKGFLKNVELAAGGLPLRKMPNWLRPIVGWLMPKVGPKGIEFAKARLEMKALETIVHLRREAPKKIKTMVPNHVWQLANRYGLKPGANELPK